MSSEDLSFYYSCKRQIIKQLSQHFPDIVVFVLSHAFIIETIILSNTPGFVVASKDSYSFFVSDLQAEKQTNSLDRVVTSINIISKKQVVSVGDTASNFEEFHEIVELSMNVSTDVDWCSHIDNIGFFIEDLPNYSNWYFALSHKTLISCSLRSLH